MKKKIISTLSSAFVIPGLGQIINGQIAKGSILLGGVTALFILIVVKVSSDVVQALNSIEDTQLNQDFFREVTERLARQSHTYLIILGMIFLGVWVYSVVDAYRTGKRLDGDAS